MTSLPPTRPIGRMLILCLATCLITAAWAADPAEPAVDPGKSGNTARVIPLRAVTVGEFVVKLADSLRDTGAPVTTLPQARSFLALRGAVIPADMNLSAPLTQRDVARLASQLGLTVLSSEPEALLDPGIVDEIVGAVRVEVENAAAPSGTPADHDDESTVSALLAGRRALIGACCRPGQCGLTTFDKCQKKGGVFRGAGIPCGPDTCLTTSGTCCSALGGPCMITVPENCDGRFRGTAICTNKTCTRDAESPIVPNP